jgi:hypothetical protein
LLNNINLEAGLFPGSVLLFFVDGEKVDRLKGSEKFKPAIYVIFRVCNTSVMFCNSLIISALLFRAIARNLADNQLITIFQDREMKNVPKY